MFIMFSKTFLVLLFIVVMNLFLVFVIMGYDEISYHRTTYIDSMMQVTGRSNAMIPTYAVTVPMTVISIIALISAYIFEKYSVKKK